jgi:predicted DCC family thiol-disulfide oxidoreductase YuxK
MSNDDRILLFDGVCNLCNGLVRFTIKRDPLAKIKFASLQSEGGQSLLKKFNLPTDDLDSFVYIIGERYYLRSTAGLHLLKDLGRPWSLAYSFIVVPAFIRDLVYKLIAKKRYSLFGKRDTCMVPTPEIRQRFL